MLCSVLVVQGLSKQGLEHQVPPCKPSQPVVAVRSGPWFCLDVGMLLDPPFSMHQGWQLTPHHPSQACDVSMIRHAR